MKDIPPDLERLSSTALPVRFSLSQEQTIEQMSYTYGVSQARVVRYLVARGLSKAPSDERKR